MNRVRDAFLLKFARARVRAPGTRWTSVPSQLGHADPVVMTDFRRRSSDIGVAHDAHDVGLHDLHSSTSDASLESSRTFRYCSANSYEDFLRSGIAGVGTRCGVKTTRNNELESDFLAKKRSHSEVTLACGEQVVSKLQLLKRRTAKLPCAKVAPTDHRTSLPETCESDGRSITTSDTFRRKNKNKTLDSRLNVLPEEHCITESRVDGGEILRDNLATLATIDDRVASLSLSMSVLPESSSDSDTALPNVSHQQHVVPKSAGHCQPPAKPPRRSRRVCGALNDSEKSSAGTRLHKLIDSKIAPTASPAFSHVLEKRSAASTSGKTTTSTFSDADEDHSGQTPQPPPRFSSRKQRIGNRQSKESSISASRYPDGRKTQPTCERTTSLTRIGSCVPRENDLTSPYRPQRDKQNTPIQLLLKRKLYPACVQDVDNGFFENFAGLPQRQRNLQQTTRQKRRSQRHLTSRNAVYHKGRRHSPSSSDAVVPLAIQSSDLPRALGMSVASFAICSDEQAEEVFVSALYTLQHPIGCDCPTAEQAEESEQLLQRVFQPSTEQLYSFRELAHNKGSPSLFLECFVIGANGLTAADPNGLSDPFCVIKMNDIECGETTVCSKTLNPVWNQKYILPLSNTETDQVQFYVFDFDEEENLAQRLGKISDIKGVKGFTRFVKDVAKVGRRNFLGQVKIKVKDLPALGVETFFKLQTHRRDPGVKEKVNVSPVKDRGRIRLRLRLLTRPPDQQLSDPQLSDHQLLEQHGKLLVTVLSAERRLDTSESEQGTEGNEVGENFSWSVHQMRESSRKLIDQHAAHCNLDQAVIALTRWIAYTQVHCMTPMNYTFLYTSLQTVRVFLQSRALTKPHKEILIASLLQFVDQCYETVHIHRHLFHSELSSHVQNMESMLRCLLIVSEMTPMLEDGVRRPTAEEIQQGIKPPNMDKLANPKRYISSALLHGNDDWYRQVYKSAKNEAGEENEARDSRCRSLILLINMLYADVEAAIETYDKIFKRNLGIHYFSSTYIQFAEKLKHEVGPIVEELSRTLPSVEFDANQINLNDDLSQQGVDMGTSLFELYMALQMFTRLSSQLSVEEGKTLVCSPLHDCHTWFSDAVNRWLEIACFKAMHRIKKAIELDQATEIDANIFRSSSAVDTVAVFYQIRTFWNQLNWPDPIGSYSFIIKVLDDIIRSADFYVRQMHVHLSANHFHCSHHPFQFTRELCLSVNSVEFVREQISRLPSNLGFELIFTSLEDQLCSESTVNCRATLQNIVDQASEDVELAIIDLVNEAVAQIIPALESELKRMCLDSCNQSSIDAISSYLESNLSTVYPLLSDVNLHRVLLSIWEQLMTAVDTQAHQNKTKDTGYFSSLSTLLRNAADIIHGDGKGLEPSLVRTTRFTALDQWLHLYSYRVDKLIALYYNRRYQFQQDVDNGCCGRLSVKACFIENVLRVEILNARDLHVSDIDACNSYVKIQLYPEKLSSNTTRLKTKVQPKTIFPLFDEVFEFSVDRQSLIEKDCCMVFTVKNHFTLKSSEILGEVVLPVSEMATLTFQQSKQAQQRLLNIFPSKILPELYEIFTALNDKSKQDAKAAEFVKTLNARCRAERRLSRSGVTSALPRMAASLISGSSLTLSSS